MEQIEECGADWAEREAFWIRHYRDAGCRLTNLTDGGEGATGLRMTAEQRARVKAARQSPEWRALISGMMQKLWADPAIKAERSAKTRMGKAAPDVRAKSSARMRAVWAADGAKEAQAVRIKAQWTSERAAAQSAGNNARWADPVWRAATIAKMRAAASTPEAKAAHAARARAVAARRAMGTFNDERFPAKKVDTIG